MKEFSDYAPQFAIFFYEKSRKLIHLPEPAKDFLEDHIEYLKEEGVDLDLPIPEMKNVLLLTLEPDEIETILYWVNKIYLTDFRLRVSRNGNRSLI